MIFVTVLSTDWQTAADRIESVAGGAALDSSVGYNKQGEGNTLRPIGLKLLGISLEDVGSDSVKPSSGYLLPFEIVSVHLLVVLIGAAYLARAKRSARSSSQSQPQGE